MQDHPFLNVLLSCIKSIQTKAWRKILLSSMVNPFPSKPWFLPVCSISLLKTLWEKEKLLVSSNFSFSHSGFYPFGELSAIFITFEIVICKLLEFGRVYNLSFRKGLRNWSFNSLPNDKILDWFKLKAFADDKFESKIKICFGKGRKHCGKRRKCWLPAFSPFPTMFSKDISFEVIKSWNCVMKG